jgi:hypothetical protein
MNTEENILEEATAKLREYSGLSIEIQDGRLKKNSRLIIDNKQFVINVKSDISKGNKGTILSLLKETSIESGLPVIIITKYIPSEIAKEYTISGINYLDIAGNCSIRGKDLVIQIEGKKKAKLAKTNQSRAFQEAGIKLIFHLLNNPDTVQLTYRELAQMTHVSLGSVGSIMQELVELHFILKTKNKKILKNKPELLERWVIAYHDVLRSRLFLKSMRFTKNENYNNWDVLPIQNAEGVVLWGGEPGASLMTNQLSPGKFTIYSNNTWKSLMQDLKLAPSENGEIEVLRMFWSEDEKYREKPTVPPLLIYADLMGSGNDRNIEIAKIILENELSYIK